MNTNSLFYPTIVLFLLINLAACHVQKNQTSQSFNYTDENIEEASVGVKPEVANFEYNDFDTSKKEGRAVTSVGKIKMVEISNYVESGTEKKIAVNTCVNRAGDVIYVEVNKDLTTLRNNEAIMKALEFVYAYKFEAGEHYEEYQCGTVTYTIDKSDY